MVAPRSFAAMMMLVILALGLFVQMSEAKDSSTLYYKKSKSAKTNPVSYNNNAKTSIPSLILGALVLSNGTTGIPHVSIEYDGEVGNVILSGYALSVYGRTQPLVSRSGPKGKNPYDKIAKQGQNDHSPEQIAAASRSINQYNAYKGFMGSPAEVITTLNTNDGSAFNGVSTSSRAEFYDPLGQFVKSDGSVDVDSIDWTRIMTTMVIAANVTELPRNITIPTRITGQQAFDSDQAIKIYNVIVAYGTANGEGPKYTYELDPETLDVHLYLDSDWYARTMAVRQRSRKLGILHAGETKHNAEPASDGKKGHLKSDVSNDEQQVSSPDTLESDSTSSDDTAYGPGIMVVSLQMGVSNTESPQTQQPQPQPQPQSQLDTEGVIAFVGGANSDIGSQDNDSDSNTTSSSSVEFNGYNNFWLMSSVIPVSQLFPIQESIVNAGNNEQNGGNTNRIDLPVIDTVILVIVFLCATVSLGYYMGYPYEFESAYGQWLSDKGDSLLGLEYADVSINMQQPSPPLMPSATAKHRNSNGNGITHTYGGKQSVYPDILPVTK